MVHLAVAPVEEAHRLAQIHVGAHGEDASGIGQHPFDDGAQLVQLQAARPVERIDQLRVGALRVHSVVLFALSGCKRPGTRCSGGQLAAVVRRGWHHWSGWRILDVDCEQGDLVVAPR